MEQRVSFITLGVNDLIAVTDFYKRMGWKPAANSNNDVTFFQTKNLIFSLYRRSHLAKDAGVPEEGSGFRGFALAYNVREKEDVIQVLAEAKAAGGSVLKEAEDTFWGGYAGYFADPEGHLWEVAWNPSYVID